MCVLLVLTYGSQTGACTTKSILKIKTTQNTIIRSTANKKKIANFQ